MRAASSLGKCPLVLTAVVGQGFGGIPQGGATDPNAGLLFIVLACTLYTLIPFQASGDKIAAGESASNATPNSRSEKIVVPG